MSDAARALASASTSTSKRQLQGQPIAIWKVWLYHLTGARRTRATHCSASITARYGAVQRQWLFGNMDVACLAGARRGAPELCEWIHFLPIATVAQMPPSDTYPELTRPGRKRTIGCARLRWSADWPASNLAPVPAPAPKVAQALLSSI